MRQQTRNFLATGASAALLAGGLTALAAPTSAAPEDEALPTSVTLVGDLQTELGCAEDWLPGCVESSLPLLPDSDGLYSRTFTVPEGTWEYKVALGDTWDDGSYPADNRSLTIAGPADINFVYRAPTDGYPERLALVPTLAGEYTDADAALVQEPVFQPGSDQNFYFVLVDRFNNGDPTNDWGGAATAAEGGFDPSNRGFYFGGDIAGLSDKLDYIEGLGTSAIWLAPMFKNQYVQGEGENASAGYHGYWVTDFTQIDPHFGTNAEMAAFIDEAHERGIKVYFDIITNHTADIIYYEEGEYAYRDISQYPYYDADGDVIDVMQLAATRAAWPELDPLTSFPYTPVTAPDDAEIKVPAWLNDVTLYHNRGDTTWEGESVTFGDFYGLDDLMTEHPDVVDGFVDIYNAWVDFGIDGFRIDTVKHVNFEFWEDWTTPVADHAQAGDPEFFMFGEVYSADPAIASEYARKTDMSSVLDFAFQDYAVSYATGASAKALAGLFAGDAYYVTPKTSPNALPTFLGNHDMGRVGGMVDRVSDSLDRAVLAHQLMYLTRGQPVVYYGDEQGFAGGGDKDARQPLFGDHGGAFSGEHTIDGRPITALPLFDTDSVLYKAISELAELRDAHPALKTGGQVERYVADGPGVYAFSRVAAGEKIEYLVAVNNASTDQEVTVPALTAGANFAPLYGTTAAATSDATGDVALTVPALSAVVLVADRTLSAPSHAEAFPLSAPHPGAALGSQARVAAQTDPAVWQETSFAWRVVGSDTWTPLGATPAAAPAVYHDLADSLATGTLIEYRAVTTDAAGNHAASSTYASVGIAVGVEDDPGVEFEINMVNIPGDHQTAMGCAGSWAPACEESKLIQIANGLWKNTFDVPAGNYEWKVALNGSWDVNYGADGVLDGPNMKYATDGGPIDFYWDPVSKIATTTALGRVTVIAGDFQSQLGCEGANGGNWQPWCFASLATNLGDGTFEFTTDKVTAGTYQAKAAFDTGWDHSIGYGDANVEFTLSQDYAPLRFVVDTNAETLCVYEGDTELFCPAGPPGPGVEAGLTLNPSSVAPGESFEALASGFWPGESVWFVIASAPGAEVEVSIEMGVVGADMAGAATGTLYAPSDLPPGSYVVQARGETSERTAEAELTVTGAVTPSPTPTPSPTTTTPSPTPSTPGGGGLEQTGAEVSGLMLASLALVLGGLAIGAARRRAASR